MAIPKQFPGRLITGLCIRLAVAAAFALYGLSASAEMFAARVGDAQIAIPVPAGFVEPSEQLPQLGKLAQTMTPPTNTLLSVFVPDSDVMRTKRGQAPLLNRYFLVQTMKSIETREVSMAEYTKFQASIRNRLQTVLDSSAARSQSLISSAAKQLGDEAGIQFTMKVGEAKALSIDDERETALSQSVAMKYESQVDGTREDVQVVMSSTTILVKGKIIFVFAYSRYEAPTDLAWVRTQARTFVDQFVAAN